MVPGFADRIVVFTRVRIDHQRQRGKALQMLQRGGGVLQGDTVNAQGNPLRVMCQRSDHVAQRGAVAQMLAVAQGEREPRPGARVSCQ